MHKYLYAGLILAILCFSAESSAAQDIIRQSPCNTTIFQTQIDSIKSALAANGFRLLREASMKMESQYEMPVIMPLNQKELYNIVFIGDEHSRLFEARMFDLLEAQLYYEKKLAGDQQANVISFPFIPGATCNYMLSVVQIQKKKKDLCGYVMLFRRETVNSKQ